MFNWFYKKVAKFVQPNEVLVAEIVAKKVDLKEVKVDTDSVTKSLAENSYFAAEVGQAIAYNLDMKDVVNYLDTQSVASHISIDEIAECFDGEEIVQKVASNIEVSSEDVAEYVDLAELANFVEFDSETLNALGKKLDYKKLAIALLEQIAEDSKSK